MKYPFIFICFFTLLVINLSSCKKNENNLQQSGDKIEIYLLQDFAMIKGKCKIDNSTIILKSNELISNDDILHYKLSDHTMLLTNAAIEKIRNVGDNIPFCLTVDRAIVYSGFFKPGYSSLSCDHSITIDPWSYQLNEININLGYPSSIYLMNFAGDDPRENNLLIEALRKQGKLR